MFKIFEWAPPDHLQLVDLDADGGKQLVRYDGEPKGFFELSQGLVSILAPPLAVVFLAGIMWKRVNSIAAETVLYGGGLLCLAVGACHVLSYPYNGYWPHVLMILRDNETACI